MTKRPLSVHSCATPFAVVAAFNERFATNEASQEYDAAGNRNSPGRTIGDYNQLLSEGRAGILLHWSC